MDVVFNPTPVNASIDGTVGIIDQGTEHLNRKPIFRIYAVQGNGVNGGNANQYAYPDLSKLVAYNDTLRQNFLDPLYARFYPAGDLAGNNPGAAQPCNIRVVNSKAYLAPGIPVYKDFIFVLFDNESTLMAYNTFYRAGLNPLMPAVWTNVILPAGEEVAQA